MALYSIGKKAGKEYYVELSDSEVKILVKLIKENMSAKVKDLYLEPLYPEIFEKLDRAYFKKECNVKKIMSILDDYRNDNSAYDICGLVGYCEWYHGYSFDFNPEEYFNKVDLEDFEENPGSYKDEIDEIECDIFNRWFDDYLSILSQDESLDFYCDLVREGILVGRVNYIVKIPFAIIKKARE